MNERDKCTPGRILRCFWTVQAGLFPGTPIPEYTRQWSLTSEAYEADPKCLDKFRDEVYEYARLITGPQMNWVRVEFIWM
jgi:hypothetical protein